MPTNFDTTTAKDLWQTRLSTTRFSVIDGAILPKTTATGNNIRSNFHIDYDRVVFSRAFRKLGRKTQVHPFAQSDHTHNRLTHSVEVASVGRSIGNQVGAALYDAGLLPPDFSANSIGAVVQVACLAHDLGNPPFGHTGEQALREWFCDPKHAHYLENLTDKQRSDICTYEGNAHSLRTVLNLEMYKSQGGMRLTAASIGALIKYPWASDNPKGKGQKFNIYQSELPLFRHISETLDLPKIATDHWARHPLSYLMEAADDICYALLDLEDAVEMGMISVNDFQGVLKNIIDYDKLINIKNTEQRLGAMRGTAIGRAVEAVTRAFMTHHDALLTGKFEHKDLLAVIDPDIKDMLNKSKKLAADEIFRHNSKLATEIAAFGCLSTLLDLFIPAIYAHHHGSVLSTKHTLALDLLGFDKENRQSLYEDYMTVLDFICGLTDNTAAKLARDISGVGMI
ncbi:deoxyguanosinetriphosphate triphosphohydrolase [Moraxella sp. FZFQ2102]|uniref:deoxyguanosinetriphosphate triphosphohydrolase n=1 Tax=Moraxella sp. FZFQ2102 TaxID=2953752 RepID=UPI00209C0F43|nr:deoxyguanosinetriphosphate triphosphohydrolase [Moraxella sp. FZFQ2102]USZ13885.1 deoxyguanosinetriphosphate triphosphohydrolase [Moraxella sp. FZFQ2102]